MNDTQLLEKIFGSRTRVKLLRLFLTHPKNEYFVREIARTVNEQINSVRRELQNLESIGALVSVDKDKKKYYQASLDFILYEELRNVLVKSRITLERGFIQSIEQLGAIRYIALTGYFVSDQGAQIDLFIVGTVNRPKLERLLEKFKEQFGTQLRFTAMPIEEYQYRKDVTDKFLYSILNGKKMVVVDKLTPR